MNSSGEEPARPVVQHREDLIYLLTEAAELEHGLMCSYLFAAFSLKRETSGMSAREQRAIAGWRKSIMAVAMEEMLHLTLVQNLLTAIGGAPHLQRPNFPIAPGLYPSDVVIALRRFDAETLDHFIYLERPEHAQVGDAAVAAKVDFQREPTWASVTPTAQDYRTVGALYRGIEEGFSHLAATLGQDGLFVGDRDGQVGPSLAALDGLHEVVDLESANRAVQRIIEQGEGGRVDAKDSHFDRFQRIRDELGLILSERPSFEPSHCVVSNPVMNAPADGSQCVHVCAVEAARVLDLATGSYALMVQLLACFFCGTGAALARKRLIDTAIALMKIAIAPLSELLATLPVSDDQPGKTAGMSFTLPRSMHALPHHQPAGKLLRERLHRLADACGTAGADLGGGLVAIGEQVGALAQSFQLDRA